MSLHVQQSGSLLMIRRRSFIAGIFGFVAGGNNASNGTQIGHGPYFIHPPQLQFSRLMRSRSQP